ncbi:MAG: TetR/AcrR family transcriptional regulator [Chitinophagales bacterium]
MPKNHENDTSDSRKKILQAAEEVFSEKGFDGARVDEIARRSGVNKALLYYYFQNKESILDELRRRSMEDMIHSREQLLGHLEQPTFADLVMSFQMSRDFLENHRAALNVVLLEAFKQDSKMSLPEFLTPVLDNVMSLIDRWGQSQVDRSKTMLEILYFVLIPNILFAVTGDQSASVVGLSADGARDAFTELLRKRAMEFFDEA